MRRMMLVAALSGATLVATAGSALAVGAEPNENNCYGAAVSDFLAGPGGNPGTTNGLVTSGLAQDQMVDDFQQAFREAAASCGTTGQP
jgi:uncharacterized membrane protein